MERDSLKCNSIKDSFDDGDKAFVSDNPILRKESEIVFAGHSGAF